MTTKNFILIVFLTLVFSGCNSVYFTEPQPVNSKSIYEFPAKYQGVWMEGEDTIIVTKNVYKSISYQNSSLAKSVADTSSLHVLANGKIYLIDKDDRTKLTGGFQYDIIQDTIRYKKRDLVEVFLGGNAFLRKVGDGYILNIKSDDIWWDIVLIERAKDGSLIGRRLSKEDMDTFQDVKPIWASENVTYFDVKWKEHDLAGIIKAGCFSDTIINLTSDSKIRKRKFLR
jgi:hypothetical protein